LSQQTSPHYLLTECTVKKQKTKQNAASADTPGSTKTNCWQTAPRNITNFPANNRQEGLGVVWGVSAWLRRRESLASLFFYFLFYLFFSSSVLFDNTLNINKK